MSHSIYWPQIIPYSNRVVQLAHFDDGNGSTAYTNSAKRGNTFGTGGFAGGPESTAQFKFGGCSYHNQNGNPTTPPGGGSGLLAASITEYNFSTVPFTIEWWQRLDTLNKDFDGAKVFFDMRDSSGTKAWVPTIVTRANQSPGDLAYFANGATRISATAVLTAGVWQNICVCRTAGVTRMFVNGIQVGSDFPDLNTYVQGPINYGCASTTGAASIGYFDELRITNGVGWYAANYTPATAEFVNQ